MKKFLRIIGVYNANSGFLGELGYITRKILGIRDCVLCNITYRGFKKNIEWIEYQKRSNNKVELIYLNDQDLNLEKFTEDKTPCVVGETNKGFIMLITKDELRRMRGNVQEFQRLLEKKLTLSK